MPMTFGRTFSPVARAAGRAGIASFILALVLLPAAAHAQSGTVQGRVTYAGTAQPVPGAQVVVDGTALGSVTRDDGEYTIAGVPAGRRTIVARRVGITPERREVTVLGAQTTTVDFVVRQTATTLEELVVTGTAAPTSRRALGTSIASVDSASIGRSGAVTVDAALQGKIAGAQITQNSGNPGGGGVSVRLRGTSSVVSGSEPLYIVDGVIVDNSSDQLVDLGARSNVQNRLADIDPNDIERIEVVRGAAAAALFGSRANNGVVQIFTRRGRAGKPKVTLQTRASAEQVGRELQFNRYGFDNAGNPVTRFDFQDRVFTTGKKMETHLSIEGGTPQTTYYVGVNNTDQGGIIRGSEFSRRGGRINLNQQIASNAKLEVGAQFTNTHNEFDPNGEQTTGIITALLFTPTTFNFNPDPRTGVFPFAPTGATFANPLAVIANFDNPQDINHFIGNVRAQVRPVEALSLDYNFGYDGYSLELNQFIPRNNLRSEPGGRSFTALRDSRILNQDAVATLNLRSTRLASEFTTSIGVNHTFQRISTLTGSATNLLPAQELLSAGALTTSAQSRVELVTLGYYAQQTVGFRDRLYLNGAIRSDASSTFGPDERTQIFPKASVSYVVSEENFFAPIKDAARLNSLRLRAAVGYAGNQPSIDNAYARFDLAQRLVLDTVIGLSFSTRLGNRELKPERQREVEAGVDLAVLNDRVALEVTGYRKRVRDLLLPRQLRPSTGYLTQLANIGEMSNTGVEVLLRTVNLDRPRWRWESTTTYSRNKNRVDKLVGAPFSVGYANRVQQGEPIGFFYGQYYQRNTDGSIKLDPNTGRPMRSGLLTDPALQQKNIGDPNPDFLASFLNEFRVGERLRARVLFDGVFGNEALNFSRRILDIFGTGRESERELLPLGDPRRLPAGFLGSRGPIFEEYVEDASFVKLREISFAYTLPPRITRFARLGGGAELSVSGRNLYTWTDYTGYDPETNLFGTSTVGRGNDFATYPIPRTYTVGLRLTY